MNIAETNIQLWAAKSNFHRNGILPAPQRFLPMDAGENFSKNCFVIAAMMVALEGAVLSLASVR